MDDNITTTESMAEDGSPPKIEFLRIYGDHVHAYLGLMLCIVGSIFNILNLMVYTRKNMKSPINTIFTFLAIADLFVLLLYIPLLWYTYLSPGVIPEDYQYSFEGELLMLGHRYVMVYFINVTTWLTVAMSVFRWISIAYPLRNGDWCSLKIIRIVITAIFVVCLLFQLVDFFFAIMTGAEYYKVEVFGTLITPGGEMSAILASVYSIYALTTGVVFRIIPSILIAAFSLRLVFVLLEVKKLRRKITSRSASTKNTAKGETQMRRTTLILVVLSLISLVTLVPRGLLHLSYCFNEQFFQQLKSASEVFEMLVLINSTFPFIVYYVISTNFRHTLQTMYRRKTRDLGLNFSSMTNHTNHTDISLQPLSNESLVGRELN